MYPDPIAEEMKIGPGDKLISIYLFRRRILSSGAKWEKLKFLDILYENHIEMNGQVVACRHVNDGTELERTITDLSKRSKEFNAETRLLFSNRVCCK